MCITCLSVEAAGGPHVAVSYAEPHRVMDTPTKSKPHLSMPFSTHQERNAIKARAEDLQLPNRVITDRAFVMWRSIAR